VLLATLDASITLIAMPDIFRGIHLDPLVPANGFYLLWMIFEFLIVTSVLIVSLATPASRCRCRPWMRWRRRSRRSRSSLGSGQFPAFHAVSHAAA
jgi:hypothetical protein